MVQNIGNTFGGGVWLSWPDAVEESRACEPEKRICIARDGDIEFSGVMPGVWDQSQDVLQVARAFFRAGVGRDERVIAPSQRACWRTAGGGRVRDCEAATGTPQLGCAQAAQGI